MKTKNNVQKTIFRFFAVVITFVLVSFTVSAQNFWKVLLVNSSFNEIALALTDRSESENSPVAEAAIYNAYLMEEVDPAWELQSWMFDDAVGFSGSYVVEQAPENELGLEDWMTDEGTFDVHVEVEDEQVIEPWMMDQSVWAI